MFISSYEKLRLKLIDEATITSLVQLEYSGFDGATVPICTFTLQNCFNQSFKGGYVRLSDFRGAEQQDPKTLEAIKNPACGWFFRATACDFKKIPGTPISFWVSNQVLSCLEQIPTLDKFGWTRKGMATGNNDDFVRIWYEIDWQSIGFGYSRQSAQKSKKRYFPYANGGEYKKWYGNESEVVNWENDGYRLQTEKHETGRIRAVNLNLDFIFLSGVTWTSITSSLQSYRLLTVGHLFSSAANSYFLKDKSTLKPVISFLNTKVAELFAKALNPTLNANPGDVGRLPFKFAGIDAIKIVSCADEAINVTKSDWDNFETSWDFRDFPLLRGEQGRGDREQGIGNREQPDPSPLAPRPSSLTPPLKANTLEASWHNWAAHLRENIATMQRLETENNRLWIEAYGLQDELTPDVPEDEITLARPDRRKDMAAFLSYAVGCMMGRYALDAPGLILADAGSTLEDYEKKIREQGTGDREQGLGVREEGRGTRDEGSSPRPFPLSPHPSFPPDADGLIPVLDGEWFDDDIVARAREFLRVTFGEATLDANIRFIEDSLGKDLRSYFAAQFYKDHLQTYKKRPIYWLFRSPKGGFQCLMYLHRYHKDTANRVLSRYLREYISKLESRIAQLDDELTHEEVSREEMTRKGLSARDKARFSKERDALRRTLRECQDWEHDVLMPLAQRRIELDLDDGVKVNYLKLGPALATIQGLGEREEG
jgi:hypothetical protein